jgi:hypothetical protein
MAALLILAGCPFPELTSLEAVNAACTDLDDRALLRWTRTLRLTQLNIHATLITGESFRHIIRTLCPSSPWLSSRFSPSRSLGLQG